MSLRLIKKYKNRRLYDTALSQYITIDDLKHYVLDGVAFRVEEAADQKDITNTTLLQIFVDTQTNSTQFLSAEILRQLIILANHPMNQAFQSMIENMLRFRVP
jgi:polyhydroxyalkanoate synthesis repressor PhaR